MKNFIRKWLGIDEIESNARDIKQALPDEIALRLMIGEAIESALDGKPDEKWWPYLSRSREKNTLNRALEKASVNTAAEVAKEQINKIIGSETFIDEVVSRIQRKQLNV